MRAATRSLWCSVALTVGLSALGLLQQLGWFHTGGAGLPLWPRPLVRTVLAGVPADGAERCFGAARGDGTSLIAVSSNRTASLASVLPSWLAVRGLLEVVVVDWGSEPPLSLEWLLTLSGTNASSNASSGPRVRLVRARWETAWTLSRAYNLAAQFARGATLLKVDADTRLHPAVLENQTLPPSHFGRGCRDRAPDANSRHLNGVALMRAAHFAAVGGYDERMAHYGYDDTDLYARLQSDLNLSSICLDFRLMAHVPDDHAVRGLTRVHLILHKRAATEIFPPWHSAGFAPSEWQVVGGAAAAAATTGEGQSGVEARGTVPRGACEVRCVRRAPYFEELLAESDELLLAHQEALHQYSGRALKWPAVSSLSDLGDMRTLMQVYDDLLAKRVGYVAVRPMHGLANRLRAMCSARAYAEQTGRRLLLVWEPDVHVQAEWSDLFERDEGGEAEAATPPLVLRSFDAGLFPDSLWLSFNQMTPAKARRRRPVSDDPQRRGLLVTSAYRLETEPPLDIARFDACLRSLRPVPEVRQMLLPRHGTAGLAARVGVHVRQLENQSADIPGIDADQRPLSNLQMMNEATPHRRACNGSHFARAMRAMLTADPNASFYLAVDAAAAYAPLLQELNASDGAVAHLANEAASCGDGDGAARRGVGCVRVALADLLNLGGTGRLLLSAWSSWEEVLTHMAAPGTPHARGCDVTSVGEDAEAQAGGVRDRRRNGTVSRVSSAFAGNLADAPLLRTGGDGSGGGGGKRGAKGGGRGGRLRKGVRGGGRAAVARPALEGEDFEDDTFGRQVPGMTIKKVASTAALPDRRDGLKVRVHKTRELSAVLPASVRELQLIFLVKRSFTARHFATKVQTMLQLGRTPRLRLHQPEGGGAASAAAEGGAEGELLEGGKSLGGYFDRHGDFEEDLLHLEIVLR